VTLTANSVQLSSVPLLERYTDIEGIVLTTGAGDDRIRVSSTSATTRTFIEGGPRRGPV
jgi:hypothetical protein